MSWQEWDKAWIRKQFEGLSHLLNLCAADVRSHSDQIQKARNHMDAMREWNDRLCERLGQKFDAIESSIDELRTRMNELETRICHEQPSDQSNSDNAPQVSETPTAPETSKPPSHLP